VVIPLVVALGWPLCGRAMVPEPEPTEPELTEPEPELTEPEPAVTAEPTEPLPLTPEQRAEQEHLFNRNEAKRHYNEAKRLFNAERYPEAAVEFDRAYATVPIGAALYNMALSHERAGKAVEAVEALRRYLALPDCSTRPPEDRTVGCAAQLDQARGALQELWRRVGELTLEVADGVALREVRVAGRTVPPDDFPLLMLPGTVDVELFGMGPEDRRTRPAYITAGEVYTVYVAPFATDTIPKPVGPDNDVEVDRLRRDRQQRALKTSFWLGTGLTAASGVALAVMGGLTRYHQQRYVIEKCPADCFEQTENGDPILDDQGQYIPLDIGYPLDHKAYVERYRPITNALVGVTLGLAVSTTLVGAFAFRKRNGERTLEPVPGRAQVRVRMGAPGLIVRW
jgi:hypothetical protein